MPIAKVQIDGRIAMFDVPEGTTPQQVEAQKLENRSQFSAPEKSFGRKAFDAAANIGSGALSGAGSIGSTILYPVDKVTDLVSGDNRNRNKERRQSITETLQNLGADPSSGFYQAGKLGGEIAGTAGVGGVAANLATRVPGLAAAAPELISAVRTSGMTAGPSTGIANMATRAAGGAISGGLSAGLVDPSQAGTGALVGGALPPAIAGAGKLGSAIGTSLRGATPSAEVNQLASRAKQLGIDIPADRLTDSRPLNAVASALNYVPFSGRAATENLMERQLNTAASRLVGQNTPNMTQALRQASVDLGNKFETTLKNNVVKVDNTFMNELASAEALAKKELGSDALRPILNQLDEILAKGGSGQIDGQAAYNIKRSLDRIGRRNTPEAYHALELKNALMGALDRSLGPQEAAAFAKTREQYGNMIALEKIAKNGAEGDISVARLANMKNINNDSLQELADIASQFVKPREGQHGAMQRALVGGASALHGGPAGLAALAAGGRGINATLNSDAARSFVQNVPSASTLGNRRLEALLSRSLPQTVADQ